MGKFKLNKKHLFFFVTLLLVFSLNLNTFAATSTVIHFADTDYECSYNNIDCTSSTTVSTTTATINDVVYNATRFTFPTSSNGYEKYISCVSPLNLYTDTNYVFNMILKCGDKNSSSTSSDVGVMIFYYVDGEHHSSNYLFEKTVKNGVWSEFSGTYKTPDISGNVSCSLLFVIRSDNTGTSLLSPLVHITDLIITLDDPLVNGTPIGTPSTDDLNNALNDYNDVMGQLPQVDNEELEDLMNFDFDSFTDGMTFVRDMFERTMNTFGFNSILVFGLTIGLATYIIGRKVG